MGFSHWLSNAAATAGRAVGSMQQAVNTASGAIAAVEAADPDLVGQLPPNLVNTVNSLASQGTALVQESKVLQAAVSAVPKDMDPSGFYIATQLLQKPVSAADIARVRATLAPNARLSFDMGVTAHIGTRAHPPPPGSPATQAGYVLTKGAQGATDSQKQAIVAAVAIHPETRAGATQALADIHKAREGHWKRFLRWLGLRA